MLYVGVDVGNEGGIVAVDSVCNVVFSSVMPTLAIGEKVMDKKTGKMKKRQKIVMDFGTVRRIFDDLRHRAGVGPGGRIAMAVAIEWQQSRPEQGIASTAKLLRDFGRLEGLVAAWRIRYELPKPQTWQTVLKGAPGKGKGRSINYVSKMLPELDLLPGRKCNPHDGLADAGVIAMWMRRQDL